MVYTGESKTEHDKKLDYYIELLEKANTTIKAQNFTIANMDRDYNDLIKSYKKYTDMVYKLIDKKYDKK